MTRRRSVKGSVITEFAVGSVLLFTMLTGVFQFGYTFYQYDNLHGAIRRAAQYGALRAYDAPSGNMTSAYRDAVRNMAIYGAPEPAAGAVPIAPGLKPEHIQVEVAFENLTPSSVTVTLSGYAVEGLFRSHVFQGSPRVSFPYLGRYAGGG